MDQKYGILCVDDDENTLKALARVLRAPDYDILYTVNIEEAFGILAKTEIDLVIVDERMPVMPGAEFVRKVREQYPHIIRILLSGHTDFDSLVKAVNEGEIFRFIAKPWDTDVLKDSVRLALEQRRIKMLVENLLRNVGQISHLADSVCVEPLQGQNSILIRVQDQGKVFSKDSVLLFLTFLFTSLGLEGQDHLKAMADGSKGQTGQISMTLDLGKGVLLRVEFPGD